MCIRDRTYSWEQRYDSARILLQKVIKARKKHYDALDAMIDVGLWSLKNDEALKAADQALAQYPADTTFLYKKAKALHLLDRDKEALPILQDFVKKYPESSNAKALLSEVEDAMMKNRFGIHYIYDFFTPNMPTWNQVSIEYQRDANIGPIIGRLNYAKRFNKTATQLEFDAYPHISKGTYFYFNMGFSGPNDVFPRFRVGAEVFQALGKGFELSIGFRHLTFDSTRVMVYTGTASYYYKNYLFTFRPYISFIQGGVSKAFTLMGRYYIDGSINDYVTVLAGTGNSPDDHLQIINQGQDLTLHSTNFYFDYQRRIAKHFILRGFFGFANEEYKISKFRSRNSVGGSLYYMF